MGERRGRRRRRRGRRGRRGGRRRERKSIVNSFSEIGVRGDGDHVSIFILVLLGGEKGKGGGKGERKRGNEKKVEEKIK